MFWKGSLSDGSQLYNMCFLSVWLLWNIQPQLFSCKFLLMFLMDIQLKFRVGVCENLFMDEA